MGPALHTPAPNECGTAGAVPRYSLILRRRVVVDRRRWRSSGPRRRRGIRAAVRLHPPAPPAMRRGRRDVAAPATSRNHREDARPPWPYQPSSDGRSVGGRLAFRFPNGIDNARFGDAAEIVVDGRSPPCQDHVEPDGSRQNIGLVKPSANAVGGDTALIVAVS